MTKDATAKPKKDLKVMVLLDEETKRKLNFLCERDSRNMSNMLLSLINEKYRQYMDAYDELLAIRGKVKWEGNLDEMRDWRNNPEVKNKDNEK
jgi:hypothetical protein